jgi:hypothetical protein
MSSMRAPRAAANYILWLIISAKRLKQYQVIYRGRGSNVVDTKYMRSWL